MGSNKVLNNLFIVIGGSNAYNLQVKGSDVDLLCLTDDNRFSRPITKLNCGCQIYDNYSVIRCNKKQFTWLFDNSGYVHCWQWLYPKSFVIQNSFTNFITTIRDSVLSANRLSFYNSYLSYAYKCYNNLIPYYKVATKRVAYGMMFLDILVRYAEGENPSSLFYQQDKRDYLVGIRNKQIPVEEIFEGLSILLAKVKKLEDFYTEPTDKSPIQEFVNVVNSIAFLDYDDYVKYNKKGESI